jgi:hypothetical protein
MAVLGGESTDEACKRKIYDCIDALIVKKCNTVAEILQYFFVFNNALSVSLVLLPQAVGCTAVSFTVVS